LAGTVKVIKYVAVHDVGRVINLMGAEQQVEGGVIMSLGSTLYEEMLTDQATGLPLNGNMLEYRVPSIKDVPENIEVYFVEKPKEYGVYGAHGLGEPPMGPPGRPSPMPCTMPSVSGSTSYRSPARESRRRSRRRLRKGGQPNEAVRPVRADQCQRGHRPAEPARRNSKGRRGWE